MNPTGVDLCYSQRIKTEEHGGVSVCVCLCIAITLSVQTQEAWHNNKPILLPKARSHIIIHWSKYGNTAGTSEITGGGGGIDRRHRVCVWVFILSDALPIKRSRENGETERERKKVHLAPLFMDFLGFSASVNKHTKSFIYSHIQYGDGRAVLLWIITRTSTRWVSTIC